MSPVEYLNMAVAVLASGLGATALVLALRSTPRLLVAAQDELTRQQKVLADKLDELDGAWEKLQVRVTGDLEELTELLERVETKRRRTLRAAERAERAENNGVDSSPLSQAIQQARLAGWTV